MKKLSEAYKELGIAFALPIEIKDSNGNTTYHEATNGFWYKYEYDANGNETYYETSHGFSYERKYDSNGNEIHFEDSNGYFDKREYDFDGEVSYYENSTGVKIGTPRSAKTCECGGNLVFRDAVIEEQLKEQLDGYIYSYECDKCQMLHFYKFKQQHDTMKKLSEITIKMPDPTEVIIKAELDDEAFKVGDFIQELGKIQEQYFDALCEKVKKNGWIEGMDDKEARDWLFDYCFNGWDNDNNGFDLTFSETIAECESYKIK